MVDNYLFGTGLSFAIYCQGAAECCRYLFTAHSVGYTAVFIDFLLKLVTVAGPAKLRGSEEVVAETVLFLGVRRSCGSGGLCSYYTLCLECQRGTSQSSLI